MTVDQETKSKLERSIDAEPLRDFAMLKHEYQAGLDAARPDNQRFLRKRYNLGGSGDSQLDPYQLWWVREYARNMHQSDGLPGQTTEKLADSLNGSGFRLHPDTGDKPLDDELTGRWREYIADPLLCDYKQEADFNQRVRLATEQMIRDGDIFAVLLDNGQVQLIEADRCISPIDAKNITNGVELSAGVPTAYHYSEKTPYGPFSDEKLKRIPRYNENGLQQVAHIYSPHRVTSNRGYSWWHRVMNEVGMLDDLDFAMLMKAQSAAARSAIIKTEPGAASIDTALGERHTKTGPTNENETWERQRPGMNVELPVGKTVDADMAAVPNPEHIEHVRYILRKVGAAMHTPYVVLMLDASETNFSGWRGAVEASRVTHRRIQMQIIMQMPTPVYKWQLARWLPDLGATARRLWAAGRLTRHRFGLPAQKYIEPLKDAQADSLTLANRLKSPRGLSAERGLDYDDISRETVEDNGRLIEMAIIEAERINAAHSEANVDWRTLVRWQLGSGFSVSGQFLEGDENGTAQTA